MENTVIIIDLSRKHSHVNRIAVMAMTDSKAESSDVGRNNLTPTSSNMRPAMIQPIIHNCFLKRWPHQSSRNHVTAE